MWWYVARSGGIVAWALLGLSVLWGLALSTRALGPKPRPNWLLDMHRYLGGLAVIFTGVHVAGLVADSYTHFGPTEILVPFTGTWHPVAVAWGVIGMYLLTAVELTSLARKRLSKRTWRMTHMLSFPLFVFSTAHGLSAGTDRNTALLKGSMIAVSVAVAIGTVIRARDIAGSPTTGRPSRPLGTHVGSSTHTVRHTPPVR
jgi:predicted ferric reductase